MKKFTLFVVVLFLWNLPVWGQTCPPGSITLTTQAQVDSFPIQYPGCTEIAGNVFIGTNVTIASNISNLHALSQINSVTGNLSISNTILTNLVGLDNVDSIKGTVLITKNSTLLTMEGLQNLDFVGLDLEINNNAMLVDLSAFQTISFVGISISIKENNALTNIGSFDNLSHVGFTINISQNPHLERVNGFRNITSCKSIGLISNISLLSLDAFDNLVTAGVSISNNLVLTNIDAFHNLDSTGTSGLSIIQNLALNRLDAFEHLSVINGDFTLDRNEVLLNILELDSVTFINGNLQITRNSSLTNINALNKVGRVGYLSIESNNTLSNLNGLNHLTEIEHFFLYDNQQLVSLEGLENLVKINGTLYILRNPSLTSLGGLQNLNSVDHVYIKINPLLSDCAIYAVCNFLSSSSSLYDIALNAPGCNSAEEVETACGAIPVFVKVLIDNDGDCLPDSIEIPVPGIQVQLTGDVQMTLRSTQSNGIVHFGYLDSGPFSVLLPQFPTSNWVVCQDTFWINPDLSTDTITRTFLLQAVNSCPQLSLDLGLPPFFRGCLVSTPATVSVQNTGTINAENVTVAVVLPSILDLVSSSPPLLTQSGDTLFFAVGDIIPFGTTSVQMNVKTDCDTFLLGQALCIEAFAGLDNPCIAGPSFSEIRLFSQCLNDSTVRFTIKNVGNAATQNQHDYVIIEDEIVMMTVPFTLNAYESMIVDVPTDGSTYRMEATKYDDGTLTATARENCGGFSPGFITAYWFDQSLRNYDYDCRMVILSFDPNEKTAIPTGIGPEHLIVANRPMQYTIQFQNTGTDTAFRVLLRDDLSPNLNLNTFKPGFSSHPYTWEIRDDGRLEVLFSPIALPDSNVNEAASHGFFSFTIDQVPNLPDGTVLENTASIIFDYNPPIVTNTVTHTIGQLTVNIDEPQRFAGLWYLMGNPTHLSATFQARQFIPGEKHFILTDAMGRVVRNAYFSGQSFDFQRDTLPGGMYFFRIADAEGRVLTGKIVVSE